MADTLYKSSSGIKVGDKHIAFPTFASLVQMDGESGVSVKQKLDELVAANANKMRLAIYTAKYFVDKWVDADATQKSNGYNYKQTVTLTSDTVNAPSVTTASEFLTTGSVLSTGVAATDIVLQTALGVVCDGYTETGAGTVTTYVKKKPKADVPVRWVIMT